MKTLTLKLDEKIYSTSRITARLSREALAINKDAVKINKMSKEIDENDDDAVLKLYDEVDSLNNRKTNLICEVYGNQFTADEIINNLSEEEINMQILSIGEGISEVIQKN